MEKARVNEHLTRRQVEILRAIACFQERRCYSATIAELASEMGISRTTVFEHIAELRKKGLLLASRGRARSLKLTPKVREVLSGLGADGSGSYCRPMGGIPLLGRVAAGLPIEAIEDRDNLSLADCFESDGQTFALEVRGDSMVGDDIRDGDYVICRRSNVANNGELVIALVDDENATLKRFYREKRRARLEPSNDEFDTIYSDNCRVEAVVVGLVRKL